MAHLGKARAIQPEKLSLKVRHDIKLSMVACVCNSRTNKQREKTETGKVAAFHALVRKEYKTVNRKYIFMKGKEQYSKLSFSLHKYIILNMYKFAYKDTQIHMCTYEYHIYCHEIIIPVRTETHCLPI